MDNDHDSTAIIAKCFHVFREDSTRDAPDITGYLYKPDHSDQAGLSGQFGRISG